ncbi:hypothetical protein [Rosenbergiella nectarea]|uniref:hypothetical protein n=1 Tax=Rosenbergiella nectarea TaxID=988801 RepID=UPI001BDB0105|nr:hypothetical protein [Rosenbergiella nectarea]MBT0731681.1 hypothetical protein [Rosenbergiella nectarea subsp. apis]
MFGIFTENKAIQSAFDEVVLPAKIIIGDFDEGIQIPLTYWRIEQYQKSWIESLKQGLKKGDHSVLAVSMYNPETVNFIFSWVLYYQNTKVIIQNKMIFSGDIKNFSIHDLNECAGEYDTYSDGVKVSEWYTTFDEVNFFLKYLEGKAIY